MSEGLKGVLAMAMACAVWGLSGLFFKALAHVPPAEVLSHRVLWTVALLGGLLAAQGRLPDVRDGGAARAELAVAGLHRASDRRELVRLRRRDPVGRGLEASLGYYIFPLIAVALGYAFLGERFSRLQGFAIALAASAVLALTIGLGAPPWIALTLGSTFGLYGLVKSRLGLGPVSACSSRRRCSRCRRSSGSRGCMRAPGSIRAGGPARSSERRPHDDPARAVGAADDRRRR